MHPAGTHLATACYDKRVRLFDMRTGALVKTFSGHNAAVTSVIFNPHGNLLISGSKDSTVKFWDIMSGLCIKTFSSHLGEVTSVEMNDSGRLLVSASKDNSNRLWDVMMGKPVRRFKRHQNASKNFIRVGFGPNQTAVVGGSEDGCVYMWDIETGEVLQCLRGHSSIVYSAVWSTQQSLLVSCSNDKTARVWWYDETQPLFVEDDI
eukprot:TRINITY_DN8314_c0_g1::TRINITY_DN8314_c0_g1_i1::g.29147::m.29147 TRINITY_DN8314_c0_g1::TRINITY_DN8314_c0_g1_i1::g.29147  ORF type:complete len:206 (+),score=51.87,sp/Q8YRI1/YY46_NOSS1/38.74/2e-36,sp/Q8YRI1/YY46_NOSS1/38.50/2e-35,sp/Q8YRI1/YY46_NOSS1/38.10/3e-34,sp/Q8YRI1/YY46_NOSS1/37.70/1e-33,sp/Q8YRI1/YY46_NOSS1/37.57/2e-30,sp/Q8YRI1/YY46_NOSS1/34.52/6e-30,sp/Q8YRI1/YY46_NOSS1/35.38/3e-29,sp/Q8YRI1/YY46_NOSS1/35.45/3e-29,sp/Q8YRI1/YY46_NOSS1/34.92/4e-29,sp/Q8YRI1/YY46_NOSS1/34.39/3e-28,sp/Q8YRI